MIWPKASAKLKIRPWMAAKMNPIVYMAREGPVVFFSTILAAIIGLPTCVYAYKQLQEQPKGVAHQKTFYTVFRPEDYPQDLHKYCR